MTFAERSPLLRVLRYRDFRILWIGAFVSFSGGQISNLAQGYFVYRLTGDEAKLALIPFVWSIPIFVFGLFAGSFADRFDKRRTLTVTQFLFAVNALYMAAATYWGFVQYWQIIVVAVLNGLVACVEMPTRQSVTSRVVPMEDLAAAVPVNAMTFNVARVAGQALGGLILSVLGVFGCYLADGISYLALIFSVRTIKADLSPSNHNTGPLKDLIVEGALYAVRDVRLRTLWMLEAATALLGLSYAPLLPAYALDVLARGNAKANVHIYTLAGMSIGIGAFAGLLLVTQLAHSRRKGLLIRASIALMAVGLLGLAFAKQPWIAYPLFAMAGAGGIMQLNTTNALFQTLAPERLHGRVLAMHVWTLNGLSPFGVLMLGNVARATKGHASIPLHGGVPFAFLLGGGLMSVVLVASLFLRAGLNNLHRDPDPEDVSARR